MSTPFFMFIFFEHAGNHKMFCFYPGSSYLNAQWSCQLQTDHAKHGSRSMHLWRICLGATFLEIHDVGKLVPSVVINTATPQPSVLQLQPIGWQHPLVRNILFPLCLAQLLPPHSLSDMPTRETLQAVQSCNCPMKSKS